jgi:hypothetical protein
MAGIAAVGTTDPRRVAAETSLDHPQAAADVDSPANLDRARDRMTAAAQRLIAGLTATQRASVCFANLGDQARTKWSNFPAGFSPRPGVAIGDLSDAQRVLLHDLLRASTSSQGYHKMTGAIRADDILSALQGGDRLFGAAHYYASIFGDPGDTNWAWMLTGHHMTAIFTIAGNRIAFTPMFTGAQPLQAPSGIYAGWQVLPDEAELAGELRASLSSTQQKLAIVSAMAPGDVIEGPGRQTSLSSYEGIAWGLLDRDQQHLLWQLAQEFVNNAEFDAARTQLTLIRNNFEQLHFSWRGPSPDAAARFYFRVHGPRILIEYDVQEPLNRNGGHIHAITRDPLNDYGVDWLKLHYQEHNQGPPGPGGRPPPDGPPGGRPPGGPP